MVTMFDEDSALDLVCRGFTREQVLERTGIDVGYHAASARTELKGVDRVAYKVEYVRAHHTDDELRKGLEAWADGEVGKEALLNRFGISAGTSGRLIDVVPLYEALGLGDEARDAKRRLQGGTMRRGAFERFGVDNVFKLPEYQERAAETRERRYGARYTLETGSSLNAGARATMAAHMEDEGFRKRVVEKRKVTNLRRYGVESAMQCDEIKARARDTNRQRYGVDHAMQNPEIRDRARIGIWSKVAGHRMSIEEIDDLIAFREQDRLNRLHADDSITDDVYDRRRSICKRSIESHRRFHWTYEARAKVSERMRAYRASLPEDEVRRRVAKARRTSMARYGVDHFSKTKTHRDAMRRYMNDEENKSRIARGIRETSIARYGVPSWSESDEGRRRASEISKRHDVQQKRKETAIDRGSYRWGKVERKLYERLVETFGEVDVRHEYGADARYPFSCDFYIVSRDLFIELNGHWTHGGRWWDADDEFCRNRRRDWNQRGYTTTAWFDLDVRKRDSARAARLNYVVFWDGRNLLDAEAWFRLGCPDGRDWDHEYSWLPIRDVLAPRFETGDAPSLTFREQIEDAMSVNWTTFYARELAMWKDDLARSTFGTVRPWLLISLSHILDKSVEDITDREILHGFGRTGLVRPFSHFDAQSMIEACTKRSVSSVYDPCVGWGERLEAFSASDIVYNGVGFDMAVVDGLRGLIDRWSLETASVTYGNGVVSDRASDMCDAVVCHPPCDSFERHLVGIVDGSDDEAFARWWESMVSSMVSRMTRWFVLQASRAWRTRFSQVVLNHGFIIDEVVRLDVRASHSMRGLNGRIKRHEHEMLIVFERKVG